MSAREIIANTFGVKEVFGHRENEPCELCLNTADAILSALRSAGWAVVPVEPTEGMINAPRGLFLYEGPPNKKWTLGQHNRAGGYRLPITEQEAALDYVNKATRASIAWRAMLKAAQEDSRG